MSSTAIRVTTVTAVTLVLALAAGAGAGASPLQVGEQWAPGANAAVTGTAAADVISITQSPDSSVTVLVDGVQTILPAGTGAIVVTAGDGDDQVTADASLTRRLVVRCGGGADKVTAGSGPAYIDGGAGNDVLNGGPGDDVLYGGPGADQLRGGDGADYLDGGFGADHLDGGVGDDILMGGAGDDQLSGGDGDDVLAGGAGTDSYAGGAGGQHTFAQRTDVRPFDAAGAVTWVPMGGLDAAGRPIGSGLSLPAATALRQRIASDVQALLSVPYGRRLLLGIDNAGRRLGIVRSTTVNLTTIRDGAAAMLRRSGARGPGSASVIKYDPEATTIDDASADWMHRPPVVGLYHELVHAWNAATGSAQPGTNTAGVYIKFEKQAIGLSFTGIAWDNDGDASTPRRVGNVPAFTENGLRDLLGLPKRTAY